VLSVGHEPHPSATQPCPTFGISKAEPEFFQPAISRIHIGHEQTYGPNDLPVSLSTERSTCRDSSQGACQDAAEIGLYFLTVNAEEQADDVLGAVCASGAGQQFFRAGWQACLIVHAQRYGNVRAHTQGVAMYTLTEIIPGWSGASATDSELRAFHLRCAGWPERVVLRQGSTVTGDP
jgi:hypothetical protein